MGVDYVLPHPCPVRSDLGEAGLRRWAFLYMVFKYLRDHPAESASETGPWQLPSTSAFPEKEREFKRKEVEEVGQKIATHLKHCAQCPANMDPASDEFGCIGRVNYPIESCFEEFLADRTQRVLDRLESGEWPAFLALVQKGGFDGRSIARLRSLRLAREEHLLELPDALPLKRVGDGLNTNHLLEGMLGLRNPDAGSVYSREIPRDLAGAWLDFYSGVLYATLPEERVTRFSRSCSTYLQFRWLHRALRLAWKLGLPVWLD
ncbi:MAG: hypothetical protein QF492_02135 [Candidatus Krumholzibacteria bacterium]|nr:hypothetical protein [Candidatus Krumholzibacteria bacterium]MDP6668694.1 hypothetical protein [Candidatus Krumholzibacteria bacterium]MDP6796698.1 hypothetical protein [Candidatus Krumholzibacteria bacterium]MDP7022403.1 hypothetical protein [Candidatus Krumholzibacteria bacterium]